MVSLKGFCQALKQGLGLSKNIKFERVHKGLTGKHFSQRSTTKVLTRVHRNGAYTRLEMIAGNR